MSNHYLSQLRDEMDKVFNFSEVKRLCHDVRVDIDNLDGETKIDKIHHLILHLHNHDRLPALIHQLERLRPQWNWQDLQLSTTDHSASPYRGLFAFREEDAPNFFGREMYSNTLGDAVMERNFVAVIGPSGSGKSSVVMAGLVPQLRKRGKWVVAIMRPGNRPLYNLATALVGLDKTITGRTARLNEIHLLESALGRDKSPILLSNVLADLWLDYEEDTRFLLIIDQFEELYTLCGDTNLRHRFIDNLLESDEHAPVTRLLTLRADFCGQALGYRPLADALQDQDIKLGPMNQGEMKRAIVEPATSAGVSLEPGLLARILDDLSGEPGNLPLLQFALTQLWERRSQGKLTHAAYEDIERVEGALAHYADSVYEEELSELQQEQAPRFFTQLVKPGEGLEDTRRLAVRFELNQADWELAILLANHRLVVTGQDNDGQETVEVVHEALIRRWARLREWMEAERAFRKWQERLRANRTLWEENGQDEDALLRGTLLQEAKGWLAERQNDLILDERTYIQASIANQQRLDREREREQGQQRRRALALLLSVMAIIVLSVAMFLIYQARNDAELAQQDAENARQETDALRLAVASQNQLTINYELALLLAIESAHEMMEISSDNLLPLEISDALRQTLLHPGRTMTLLTDHTEKVNHVLWSPSNHYFLTASDQEINVWDAQTVQHLNHYDITSNIQHITWSPDGQYFAVAIQGEGETVYIWNVFESEPLFRLDTGNTANYLAWHKESNRLAVASDGRRVDIWSVEEQAATLVTSLAHRTSVKFVAWNEGGFGIVTISNQKTHVWDIFSDTAAEQITFANNGRIVTSAYWHPDGDQIVTIDNNVNGNKQQNNAYLWHVATGEKAQTFSHDTEINAAQLSRDGKQLITAATDGLIRIWNLENGELENTLAGHSGSINSFVWDQDKGYLLSVSQDKTAVIWDMHTVSIMAKLTGHEASVNEAIWDDAHARIISASDDMTVRVWDPFPGTEIATLSGHTAEINHVAWNHDSTKVVTASEDKTAIIWDTTNGTPLHMLAPHNAPVKQAVWSPEGNYILTVGNEGTIRFWNALTGELLQAIDGHEIFVNQADWYKSEKELLVVTASEDRTAKVWSLVPPDEITQKYRLEAPGTVHQAIWNHTGTQIATVALYIDNNPIQIWDAQTGLEILSIAGGNENVGYIDWNDDSTQLVSVRDDYKVVVWDTNSGEQIAAFDKHRGLVHQAVWQPNGNLIATVSDDGRVIVWGLDPTLPIHTFNAHQSRVNQVDWHSDGRYIVTASDDLTAIVWDVERGQQVATLRGHMGFVNQALWDPTGKQIITISEDGTARIHYVTAKDILQAACQRTVRNLSEREWDSYMGDNAYQQTCSLE